MFNVRWVSCCCFVSCVMFSVAIIDPTSARDAQLRKHVEAPKCPLYFQKVPQVQSAINHARLISVVIGATFRNLNLDPPLPLSYAATS